MSLVETKDKLLDHFGNFTEWTDLDRSTVEGYGEVLDQLFWTDLDLGITLRGIEKGPLRIRAQSSKNDTLNKVRTFRDKYEVDPTKIFRKVLSTNVIQEKLTKLDKSVKFWLQTIGVPTALLALFFAPAFLRFSILLIVAVLYWLYSYGEANDAIEVRLFVTCTALTLLWLGPIYLVIGLVYFLLVFGGVIQPLGLVFLITNLIVSFLFILVALAIGGFPKQRVKQYWELLTTKSGESRSSVHYTLEWAALSLLDFSRLLSILFGPIIALAYLWLSILQNELTSNGLETLVAIGIILAIVVLYFVLLRRSIAGFQSRSFNYNLGIHASNYSDVVLEIAEEQKTRKRIFRTLRFWSSR